MIKQSNAHLHTLFPMHRSGTADKIARTAVFLVLGDSSYVTGSELCVDGGRAQVEFSSFARFVDKPHLKSFQRGFIK